MHALAALEYGVLCMGVHMWYVGSVWEHGARALFGSMVCSGLCVHICVFIYMYQHIYRPICAYTPVHTILARQLPHVLCRLMNFIFQPTHFSFRSKSDDRILYVHGSSNTEQHLIN